jgi:membrane-associated protease RseP (regulator of RpoE activity)
VDARSQRPLDGVAVEIVPIHEDRGRSWPEPWFADVLGDAVRWRVLSGPEGTFTFPGLTDGRWRVQVQVRRPGDPAQDVIVARDRGVAPVALVYDPGNTITGQVLHQDGRPYGGAAVWIVGVDDGSGGNTLRGETALLTEANAEGRFRILRAPAGRLFVQAGRRRHGFSVPVPVEPSAGDGVAELTLRVPDERRSLVLPEGEHGGVGMQLRWTAHGPELEGLVPGMPALAAGLQAGDRVTAVDGHPTEWMSQFEFVARCRGPLGSPVVLRIQRAGSAAREVTILRAAFPKER